MKVRTNTVLRRSLGVTAAGAMMMALVPGVASAQDRTPTPRDIGDVCDGDYDRDFGDIDSTVHAEVIRCMAEYGITQGVGDGTNFAPFRNVTRQQMATFIATWMNHALDGQLPAGDPERFDDADRFAPEHVDSINALAGIDVVVGTRVSDGTEFDHSANVTRAQAASFVRRALSYLDNGEVGDLSESPDSDGGWFADEDRFDEAHAANIDSLAAVGIAAGNRAGEFLPVRGIQRDQMAAFIMRAFDYAQTFLGDDEPGEPGEPTAAPTGVYTDGTIDVCLINAADQTAQIWATVAGDHLDFSAHAYRDTVVIDGDEVDFEDVDDLLAFEAACVQGTGLDVDYDTDGPSTFTMTTDQD